MLDAADLPDDVAALKALRSHGFIDWLRRYVPTGNSGRGPQVTQTSNAYRLSLPQKAIRLLGAYAKPAPLPDDYLQQQADRAAAIEDHRAELSLAERTLFDMGDSPLSQSLARLGAFIQQRESAKKTESLSVSKLE